MTRLLKICNHFYSQQSGIRAFNCNLLCGTYWVLCVHGFSTLSHSCFTVVITNGTHSTGIRVSNCNMLFVGVIGCCVLMASAPYHINASLWWSQMVHRYQGFQFQLALCGTCWVLSAHGINNQSLTGYTLVCGVQGRHANGRQIFQTNLPDKSDKYDQFTLPFSSIIFHKIQKYAKCHGRGKGGPKILFDFWAFQIVLEIDKKIFLKIFQVPNFDKDRQTLLDALLSNFFTVFYGFDHGR